MLYLPQFDAMSGSKYLRFVLTGLVLLVADLVQVGQLRLLAVIAHIAVALLLLLLFLRVFDLSLVAHSFGAGARAWHLFLSRLSLLLVTAFQRKKQRTHDFVTAIMSIAA